VPATTTIFFGYGAHGIAGIDVLVDAGATIAAVVVPGNRSGADVDMVMARAAECGVPVMVQPPRSTRAAFVERLRALSPDLFLVWSYSMLLPPDLLEIPRLGTVNVHTGLLPEYRGGHVLQWALLNGEPETGVTLHYLDAGVDTGPIICATRFAIAADDDAVSVRVKLQHAGGALLREWWPRIADGTAPRTAQDPASGRLWPMRRVDEGRIDLSRSAAEVCRLVRALNANDPGAFVERGGERISIRRARAVASGGSDGWRLRAADADVLVLEAAIRGRRLDPSEMLELRELVPHPQPGR
jgi:methionyl-tRNA formyltransferase